MSTRQDRPEHVADTIEVKIVETVDGRSHYHHHQGHQRVFRELFSPNVILTHSGQQRPRIAEHHHLHQRRGRRVRL